MLVSVRVHPRASRAWSAWSGDVLEVWVNAPPIEDGANQAVLKAVASELDVPVYAVRLRTGARSRTKVVEVQKVAGARPATLLKSLRS
ncbi:MAG: DUF167 domain-containing protein [Candidatus Dormibacteraceae bacterium]